MHDTNFWQPSTFAFKLNINSIILESTLPSIRQINEHTGRNFRVMI